MSDQVLAAIERVLIRDPSVHACAAFRRRSAHEDVIVVYVVPASNAWPVERLRACLPDSERIWLVPIGRLPLTPDGRLDQEALERVPVIDEELLARAETAMRSLPGVREVIAVEREVFPLSVRLHFEDLVPGSPAAPRNRPPTDCEPLASSFAASSSLPSILIGKPLVDADALPHTLPGLLTRAAASFPKQTLTCIESDGAESVQTYEGLSKEAGRIASGLMAAGSARGDKIILQLGTIRNYWPSFWGCVLAGLAPVPLAIAPNAEETNLATARLRTVWDRLGRPAVLTDSPAATSPLTSIVGKSVIFLDCLIAAEAPFQAPPVNESDLALLLFTSGSTGTPKGAMQTHRALIRFCAGATQLNRLHRDATSLNWMPLEHIGAIADFHLRSLFAGASQVHVATDRILASPLRWLELLHRHCVQVSWAPNFAFGLVNDRIRDLAGLGVDLSSLQFLINAGEAVGARTAQRFVRSLAPWGLSPDVMRPTWGMSETCSGALYGKLRLEAQADSETSVDVGEPLPGLSFRVVDRGGHLLPESSIGELQVQGDTVTVGYIGNPDATQAALAEDGWFRTGDLARISQGRVTIIGREKDVIIVNGANYQPHDFESAVEGLFGVMPSSVAVCSVRDPNDDTENIAVFFGTSLVEDRDMERLVREIRGLISSGFGVSPRYILPCDPALIPKTAIGKIQRSELRRRFEAGQFDALRRRIDVLLRQPNTIPTWFFKACWRPCEPRCAFESVDPILLFADRKGLGAAVAAELNHAGRVAVTVNRGVQFRQLDETVFEIDPASSGDYTRILEVFIRRHGAVRSILHLWSCDLAEDRITEAQLQHAQISGWGSLLLLHQALGACLSKDSLVQWWIVSAGAQPVGSLSEATLGFSVIPALVKSFGAEAPSLRIRHIDLAPDWGAHRPEETIGLIMRELTYGDEAEVAYREGTRLCPRLKKEDLSGGHSPIPRFRSGGIYLLTGGLGGIGRLLAGYLMQTYACRLVVIGRTVLQETSPASAQENRTKQADDYAATFQRLQALPGAIEYHSIDVCDPAGLSRVVQAACQRWGAPLDGVLHLAGSYEERAMAAESPAAIAERLRPKVLGTMMLSELLRSHPAAFLVGFSSVSSFFGGALMGAHAAGNRFLEWYCRLRETQHPGQTVCIAWSLWDNVGIGSQSGNGMLDGFGYRAIAPEQGLVSLEAILRQGWDQALVGLDETRQNVRRKIEATPPAVALRRLALAYTGYTSVPPGETLQVSDRFGTALEPEFHHLAEFPRDSEGGVDRNAVLAMLSRDAEADSLVQAPRSAEEKRLAELWVKLLGIDRERLGITDNFFQLGGNSLLAVELMAAMEKEFGISLPVGLLLRAPTIEQLCGALLEARMSGNVDPA